MIIAIDGPAGAGKSTIARRVADTLDIQLVDTGALYRAVAYRAMQEGIDPDEAERIADLAEDLSFEFRRESTDGGVDNVLYCEGEPLGEEIRTQEVSELTSIVSSHSEVREALLGAQRELGRRQPSVLEGRDIGTVVFPDAEVKIYLTASAKERARRRYNELAERQEDVDYGDILKEIRERDERDRNRDVAPLTRADDAIEVDSTEMDVNPTVTAVLEVVYEETDGEWV